MITFRIFWCHWWTSFSCSATDIVKMAWKLYGESGRFRHLLAWQFKNIWKTRPLKEARCLGATWINASKFSYRFTIISMFLQGDNIDIELLPKWPVICNEKWVKWENWVYAKDIWSYPNHLISAKHSFYKIFFVHRAIENQFPGLFVYKSGRYWTDEIMEIPKKWRKVINYYSQYVRAIET